MDFTVILEFIGFDILFLGLLTLLTCYVAYALWHTPFDLIRATQEGWHSYKEYLRGCFESGGECPPDGKAPTRSLNVTQLVGMLLMAALLGILCNIAADRLLDNKLLLGHTPAWNFFPKAAAEPKQKAPGAAQAKTKNAAQFSVSAYLSRHVEWWQPEDELKAEALAALAKLHLNNDIGTIVKSHLCKCDEQCPQQGAEECKQLENCSNCCQDEDGAKALYQHAYAAVVGSENKSLKDSLRYEYLAVKVVRVGLIGVIVLLLVILLKLLSLLPGRVLAVRNELKRKPLRPWLKVKSISSKTGASLPEAASGSSRPRSRPREQSPLETVASPLKSDWSVLSPPAPELPRWAVRAILTFVILWLLPFLLIKLWTEQSKRYYKKVFHAYLVVAADGKDLLLMSAAKPESSPTPTPAPMPRPAGAHTGATTGVTKP